MLKKNEEIQTKKENINQVLKIISSLISSKKFGNFNTENLAFLLDCELKISEIKSGIYTTENISFLEEMIKQTLKIFNAAQEELEVVKENNK